MEKYKRIASNVFKIGLMLIIIFAIFFSWLYSENIGVSTSSFGIYSRKVPAVFEGYKIALLSDFHNSDNYEKVAKRVIESKPDFVVMAGDMVSRSDEEPENWGNLAKLLDSFKDKYPVFYSSGNHEIFLPKYNEYIQFLKDHGVTILESAVTQIEYRGNKINLVGFKDIVYSDKEMRPETLYQQLEALYNKIPDKSLFTVLIFHRATQLDTASKLPFDLILSGHTHGGQVGIPYLNSWILNMRYGTDKYIKGYYRNNTSQMIVSGGLSKKNDEPRFFNSPEVILVTLHTTE